MEHYVLVHQFRNNIAMMDFTQFMVDVYPEHKIESNEYSVYFGFAARHTSEVDDYVNEIVRVR
ncbi:MAG: hypothetical protein ACK4ND_17590 [Cytophagaceae bacterium]